MQEDFRAFVDQCVTRTVASSRFATHDERLSELNRYGDLDGYPVLQAMLRAGSGRQACPPSPHADYRHPLIHPGLFQLVNALLPRDKGAYAFDKWQDEAVIILPLPMRGTPGFTFRNRAKRQSVIVINEYHILLCDLCSRFYLPHLVRFATMIDERHQEIGLSLLSLAAHNDADSINTLKNEILAQCMGNPTLLELCRHDPLFFEFQAHLSFQMTTAEGAADDGTAGESFEYWAQHSLADDYYAFRSDVTDEYADFVISCLSMVIGHELMHVWADHSIQPPTEMGEMLGEAAGAIPFSTLAEFDADQGVLRMQMAQLGRFNPCSVMSIMGLLFMDGYLHFADDFICQCQLERPLTSQEHWLRLALLHSHTDQLAMLLGDYPTAIERSGFLVGTVNLALTTHYGRPEFLWLIALVAGWIQVVHGVGPHIASVIHEKGRRLKPIHPFVGVSPTLKRLQKYDALAPSDQAQVKAVYEGHFAGTVPATSHFNEQLLADGDLHAQFGSILNKLKDVSGSGTF